MEDVLQHDPRTKQQIINALYNYLYTPVLQQFQKRLDALITRNSQILCVDHKALVYKSVYYSMQGQGTTGASRLVPALKPAMDAYLKDLAAINEGELPYVMGFIRQVLNSSNNLQDYLRVLPSSIHHPVQKLIHTCPCSHKSLADSVVTSLLISNEVPITLMKRRMVLNLLI